MKAKNIQQLIEILQQYPAQTKWFGFDDGSVNLIVPGTSQQVSIDTDYYDTDQECSQSPSSKESTPLEPVSTRNAPDAD